MDNIIDLIATDASPAEISDHIKNLMYTKAAERIEAARPYIASTMFGDGYESGEEFEQEPQGEE
jgi:hypothetical protein